MINLLIFDLDGTLFDTAHGISKAFNNLLLERKEKPVSHELITSFIGTGLLDLLKNLDETLQHRLGDLKVLESDFHRHYQSLLIDHSHVYPHIEDFLRSWHGHMAVVSNKSERYVNELLLHKELKGLPWIKIIGGDSLPFKKPHALPIIEVIKAAETKAERTVMIGDGTPDIEAANNAGVRSIAVDFGYTPVEKLVELGAHATISNYKELATLLNSF